MFREWLHASATAAGIFSGMTYWQELAVPPRKIQAPVIRKSAAEAEYAQSLKAAD